jgi:DNA (cytosine-5)-methyltransferase 1
MCCDRLGRGRPAARRAHGGGVRHHLPVRADGVKPQLLDLFSGAGGAAKGYADAGFDVYGVDIVEQPRYPFLFFQGDAIEFLESAIANDIRFDAYHASPPCQRHSKMSGCRPGLAATYDDLIGPTRELLRQTGKPYVIENVPGAPLEDPVTLCGFMFGRELYRHRLFETNWHLVAPEHPAHTKPASRAGHWREGTVISISGHIAPMKLAREVMGIDWTNREELAESIPPYYTEWIGRQLMERIR